MGVVLKSRKVGDVLVVDMAGRLNVLDQGLRELVLEGLKAGSRHFVVNMKDLSYMDSSELGQFMFLHTSIKEANGSLKLLRPSAQFRQLLSITKLDKIFDVIDDETQIQ